MSDEAAAYDLFLSYASEDRGFAEVLVEALRQRGVKVWFDQQALKPGESIPQGIDQGLLRSRFGLLLLSPDYFEKAWPRQELDALFGMEVEAKRSLLIPVLHRLTAERFCEKSPLLAARVTLSTALELPALVDNILSAMAIPVTPSPAADVPVRLHISDVLDRPVPGLVLATVGGAAGTPTDSGGNTCLQLPPGTRPGDPFTVQIVSIPPGDPEWVLLSPWHGRLRVPPAQPGSDAFERVRVVERSCREMLTQSSVLREISQALLGVPSQDEGRLLDRTLQQAAFEQLAARFGLEPGDLDRAIRDWKSRSQDPYEKGLSLLYEERFPEAREQLALSLDQREKALAIEEQSVYEAAFFLGHAFGREGRWKEAIPPLRRALELRPDDVRALTNLGAALLFSDRAGEAGDLLRRAAELELQAEPRDVRSLVVAFQLLWLCAFIQGNSGHAELLCRTLLVFLEAELGPDHPELVPVLTSLGILHMTLRKTGEACAVFQRAVAIRERHGGDPEALNHALGNLAVARREGGELREAEALFERILVQEQNLHGRESLQAARALSGLATVYPKWGDFVRAEALLTRAREIHEAQRQPDPAGLASVLRQLGSVRRSRSDLAGAAKLYRSALEQREKLKHPGGEAASIRFELGVVLVESGELEAALPYLREALAVRDAEHLAGVDLGRIQWAQALASLYHRLNEPDEALALFEREIARGLEAGLHPGLLLPLSFGLASLRISLGEFDEAELLLSECLKVMHPQVDLAPAVVGTYTWVLKTLGREAEAAEVQERWGREAASGVEGAHETGFPEARDPFTNVKGKPWETVP